MQYSIFDQTGPEKTRRSKYASPYDYSRLSGIRPKDNICDNGADNECELTASGLRMMSIFGFNGQNIACRSTIGNSGVKVNSVHIFSGEVIQIHIFYSESVAVR